MAKERVEVEILTQVKKSLASLAKYTAAIGISYMAVKKLVQSTKVLTEAYGKQETAEAKLAAALKATGGMVGITGKEMVAYAKNLQRVTTMSDETIIGAQALMTTFTQVGKETFPRAIEAAADMSEMFGQDLQQSVIQLGTALNDPIRGVGRLRRIGISFTEDQKESIATFMEQNDIMAAQGVILDELAVEFGGVAKAMRETSIGTDRAFKVAIENVKQSMGSVFSKLKMDLQNNLMPVFENIAQWFEDNGGKIYAVFTNIVPIIQATFKAVVAIVKKAFDSDNYFETFKQLGSALNAAIGAALQTVPAMFMAVMDTLRDIVLQVGPALGKMFFKSIFTIQDEGLVDRMGKGLKKLFGSDFGFSSSNALFGIGEGTSYEDLIKEQERGWDEVAYRSGIRYKMLRDQVGGHIKEALEAYGGVIDYFVDLSSDEIQKLIEQIGTMLDLSEQEFTAFKTIVEDAVGTRADGDGEGDGDETKTLADTYGIAGTIGVLEAAKKHTDELRQKTIDLKIALLDALPREETFAFHDEVLKQYKEKMEAEAELRQVQLDRLAAVNEANARRLEREEHINKILIEQAEYRAKIEKQRQDQLLGYYQNIALAMGEMIVDQERGLDSLKEAIKDIIATELLAYAKLWAAQSLAAFATGNIATGALMAAAATAALVAAGAVQAFAEGGIVTSPTVGLVGEAGPEAIIPLDKAGGIGGTTIIINGSLIHERQLEGIIMGTVAGGVRGY